MMQASYHLFVLFVKSFLFIFFNDSSCSDSSCDSSPSASVSVSLIVMCYVLC